MQLKIVAKQYKKEYNMSKLEKEIERLKSKPKDYTYDEAKGLLKNFDSMAGIGRIFDEVTNFLNK